MRKIPKIDGLYPAPLLHVKPADGASQTQAWFAEAADGQALFIKHDPKTSGILSSEADGLRALADSGALRVPRIFHESAEWLIMEAIPREPAGPEFWQSLAEGLVLLHRKKQSSIGWTVDNFLGRSDQLNIWPSGSWVDFFWEKRLLPQIAALRVVGIWQKTEDSCLPGLENYVRQELSEVDADLCLLHGDLWSGNILCGSGQEPFLIDPAVYVGHRETDLAMTELFGGFAPAFYQRYQELWPLAPGYPRRRLIYNFYHKLNHANLYGSGYIWDVKQTCAQFRQPPMALKV